MIESCSLEEELSTLSLTAQVILAKFVIVVAIQPTCMLAIPVQMISWHEAKLPDEHRGAEMSGVDSPLLNTSDGRGASRPTWVVKL